jgi:cyclic 2,3-diphosphoglycerate synthetase
MHEAGTVDVFVTELKAAGVDVVAEAGMDMGVPTVFCDNDPVPCGGTELPDVIEHLVRTSAARHQARSE